MLFQGRSVADPIDEIGSSGFEFVVGGPELDRIEEIAVTFPDGETTRMLQPSNIITNQPDEPISFWGYYGTGEGLPGPGDFLFAFTLVDGETYEQTQYSDGVLIDLAWNVQVERLDGDRLRVSWDPVEGAVGHAMQIYTVDGMTTIEDTGASCGVEVDPGEQAESSCIVDAVGTYLVEGQSYTATVGSFSEKRHGDNASFSGNMSDVFVW